MLSEYEIKRIIALEKERLHTLHDINEWKCCKSFIAGLECVLNE